MKNNVLALHRVAFFSLLSFVFCIVSCKKEEKTPEPIPVPVANQLTIAHLKSLVTGQPVKIKEKGVIRGVVISDSRSKNIDNEKTLFIQEGTGQSAIKVSLIANHNFAVNDSLEIDVLDQTLNSLNGSVILQDLQNNLVKKLGVGKIIPRETSISELKANMLAWEGSLIAIRACELFSTTGTYNNNLIIRDGQGTMAGIVAEKATLNGQELPNEVKSVVGIVYVDGDQVKLAPRNLAEIVSLKYTTDEFTTWKNTTWSSNLAGEGVALYTEFANWHGNITDGAIKQKAIAADAVFTRPEKIYPYLPKDSLGSALKLYPKENTNLKNLKVLKITFAASKGTGDLRFLEQSVGDQEININVLSFNTGTDVANIGVAIPIESTGELIPGKLVTPKGFDDYYRLAAFTPPIKEAGKFYTATFFIPSNASDLKVMGITSVTITKWLESPKFEILNLSSRKTTGITARNRDRYIPIVIDKVEMGY